MIKIHMMFRLDRQNWTRQGIRAVRGGGIRLWWRDLGTVYINALAVGIFLLAMAMATGVLPFPSPPYFTLFLAQASPGPEPVRTGVTLAQLANREAVSWK